MEQEQRGQSLLPIEGVERHSLDLAVHEVESDRLTADDRIQEDFEKADPDLLHPSARTSLGVVALDEWDLDAANARHTAWLRLEEAGVRRQIPLHNAAPSSASK